MSEVSLINGRIDSSDTCVICGRDIPEGSQVCVICGKTEPRDLVEVRHGYWKQTQEPLGYRDVDCVECSICGESWIMDEDLSLEEHTQGWNYCLNCGAKMDGKRKEVMNNGNL